MEKQPNKSHIYLLAFPNQNLLKIGKADNFVSRYYTLKSNWGSADLENSYLIEVSADKVYKLEKALHFFYDNSHVNDLPNKEGYTEFFDLSIMPKVVDFINTQIQPNHDITIHKDLRDLVTSQLNQSINTKDLGVSKCTINKIVKKTFSKKSFKQMEEQFKANRQKLQTECNQKTLKSVERCATLLKHIVSDESFSIQYDNHKIHFTSERDNLGKVKDLLYGPHIYQLNGLRETHFLVSQFDIQINNNQFTITMSMSEDINYQLEQYLEHNKSKKILQSLNDIVYLYNHIAREPLFHVQQENQHEKVIEEQDVLLVFKKKSYATIHGSRLS